MLRRARSVKGSHIDIALGSSFPSLPITLPAPEQFRDPARRTPAWRRCRPRCRLYQRFALRAAESSETMPTVEQVREALVEVKDPELNLGILELGFVYDITTEGENGETSP